MNFYLFLVALFCIYTPVLAQDLSMKGHELQATTSEKAYQLYVSLPLSYNSEDDKRYPVLFLLDAYYSYPLVFSLHKLLEAGQEIEDVIIVAIGYKDQSLPTWYKNRMIDFTPSNDVGVDQEVAESLGISTAEVKTGQAKVFLQSIREDIIPYIDSIYKTTEDRGISGHSVGGLFAVYCLIHGQDLFHKYGINSPSLFWNNDELLREMEVVIQSEKAVKGSVFVTYGSLEPELIRSSTRAFFNLFQQNSTENFVVRMKVFDEETHASVIGASLTRTLKTLYGKD